MPSSRNKHTATQVVSLSICFAIVILRFLPTKTKIKELTERLHVSWISFVKHHLKRNGSDKSLVKCFKGTHIQYRICSYQSVLSTEAGSFFDPLSLTCLSEMEHILSWLQKNVSREKKHFPLFVGRKIIVINEL